MSDRLFDGHLFRILTVVDCHTREALSLTPRANLRALQVTDARERIEEWRCHYNEDRLTRPWAA